jgi:hypothetical protein
MVVGKSRDKGGEDEEEEPERRQKKLPSGSLAPGTWNCGH